MSKYKFDLTREVKDTVEWILGRYHEDKRQLEIYRNDMMLSTTAGYSLTSGVSGGGVSNPTESIGMKMATSPYILWTERNCAAIERVLDKLGETDRDLVDLVYWKKSYNIVGAGIRVGLSASKAYAHINNILGLVALEIGVVNI